MPVPGTAERSRSRPSPVEPEILYAEPFPVDLVIETRQRGRRTIRGEFPYGKTATIRNRGRGPSAPRKERIGRRAFRHSAESEDQRVDLLVGHDFNRPIAAKLRRGETGRSALALFDEPERLRFEALLPEEGREPSWISDLIRSIEAEIPVGVSPGFSLPPAAVLAGRADRVVPEAPGSDVYVREIFEAVLHELSFVSRAAYRETAVQLRSDHPAPAEWEIPFWML